MNHVIPSGAHHIQTQASFVFPYLLWRLQTCLATDVPFRGWFPNFSRYQQVKSGCCCCFKPHDCINSRNFIFVSHTINSDTYWICVKVPNRDCDVIFIIRLYLRIPRRPLMRIWFGVASVSSSQWLAQRVGCASGCVITFGIICTYLIYSDNPWLHVSQVRTIRLL